MPVRHKMIWCDAGWMPHQYGFCPSERVWKKLQIISKRDLGPYLPDGIRACTSMLRNYKTGRQVAIVTIGQCTPKDTIELMVHEAMHVWRDIREHIGEKEPSSEFEAYAMQNIVGSLLDAYAKTRGPLLSRMIIRLRP